MEVSLNLALNSTNFLHLRAASIIRFVAGGSAKMENDLVDDLQTFDMICLHSYFIGSFLHSVFVALWPCNGSVWALHDQLAVCGPANI